MDINNYHAIIPIKKISTELPHKNIRMFCGKPMYQWALDACLNSNLTGYVHISTSWMDFKQHYLQQYRNVNFIPRPPELDGDVELMEVMKHAANYIGDKKGVYMQVQANKPLIMSSDIDSYISRFHLLELNTLFQTQKINSSVNWEYKSHRNEKENFKSCSLCKMWDYKTLVNAKKGTWGFGKNHKDILVPNYHIEIDNEDDFNMAKAIMKERM